VLPAKGYIVAIHQIQVSPKVSGMIEKLYIKEGDKVEKGAVLAVLEKVEYESDHKHAVANLAAAKQRWDELVRWRQAEIDQARAELDEALAQKEQLYLDWKRSLTLRGAALAARDYEQAESSYKAMDRRSARLKLAWDLMQQGPRDAKIAAAKADHEQYKADLVKAKWRLDNCVITAPISGIILTKKAEEGNIVNAAAFNIAASICDMADLTQMEVDLAIPERDVPKVMRPERVAGSKDVWRCQKCQIRPEAFPDRPYEGFVSRLMPTADRAKGAVPVRVKIRIPQEEAGVYLRPEMGALVNFLNAVVETRE
jgi:multidrug resistance efflux pump